MGSDAPEPGAGTPAVPLRRSLVAAGLRVVGIITAALVVYALFPVAGTGAGLQIAVGSAVGLVLILVVFVRQYSRVSRAAQPVLAAIEALAIVFGLFLCLFALMYVAISEGNPAAFTQPVGKVAGFYFATTVLTTVGFGDIAASSDPARVIVTIQMVMGMILIGAAVKGLAYSAKQAVARDGSSVAARMARELPRVGDGRTGPDPGA